MLGSQSRFRFRICLELQWPYVFSKTLQNQFRFRPVRWCSALTFWIFENFCNSALFHKLYFVTFLKKHESTETSLEFRNVWKVDLENHNRLVVRSWSWFFKNVTKSTPFHVPLIIFTKASKLGSRASFHFSKSLNPWCTGTWTFITIWLWADMRIVHSSDFLT